MHTPLQNYLTDWLHEVCEHAFLKFIKVCVSVFCTIQLWHWGWSLWHNSKSLSTISLPSLKDECPHSGLVNMLGRRSCDSSRLRATSTYPWLLSSTLLPGNWPKVEHCWRWWARRQHVCSCLSVLFFVSLSSFSLSSLSTFLCRHGDLFPLQPPVVSHCLHIRWNTIYTSLLFLFVLVFFTLFKECRPSREKQQSICQVSVKCLQVSPTSIHNF